MSLMFHRVLPVSLWPGKVLSSFVPSRLLDQFITRFLNISLFLNPLHQHFSKNYFVQNVWSLEFLFQLPLACTLVLISSTFSSCLFIFPSVNRSPANSHALFKTLRHPAVSGFRKSGRFSAPGLIAFFHRKTRQPTYANWASESKSLGEVPIGGISRVGRGRRKALIIFWRRWIQSLLLPAFSFLLLSLAKWRIHRSRITSNHCHLMFSSLHIPLVVQKKKMVMSEDAKIVQSVD